MKSIYEYLDYRKFLQDWFVWQREHSPYFSFRYAQKRVGLDASNIAKIVNGKRHINDRTFAPFSALLKLDELEEQYLRLLVQFGRSRTDARRRSLIEKIRSFSSVTAARITADRYEFYQQWYYTAVLALIHFSPVRRGEWHAIGQKIQPAITDQQAKESIELLERLGFIRRGGNGYFEHTESIITTGEQWRQITLEQFQKQTMQLAIRAMDEIPVEKRAVSTLTVTLSPDSYQKIREITAEYRKAVLRGVAETEGADTVYQINMQIFPLSRGERDE